MARKTGYGGPETKETGVEVDEDKVEMVTIEVGTENAK